MSKKEVERNALKQQASEEIIDIEKLGAKSEVTSSMRNLKGYWVYLVTVVAVTSSLFHFYTAGYRPLPAMQQRPVHLAFILLLTFLLYPASAKSDKNRNPGFIDVALGIIAVGCSFYLVYHYRTIALRGGWYNDYDIFVGFIFCLTLIEAARRTMGSVMLILAGISIAYLFIGPYLPGIFQHGGFTWRRIVGHMFMSIEGVFGVAIGVAATYVYLFILFGAFLQKSGTTKLFANFALAMAGHTPGGPAKVAVIASGLMGTIQGSSAANVAATGMFTIPLMKSLGFKSHFAAAVEAVASCGGQFLPPVMGASAFIMAEYLGAPYAYVAAGAALPAILYYIAVYYQVHLRAIKVGMVGIPRNRLPAVKGVIIKEGHLLLPIVILITMLILKYTALFAAFFSILAIVIISALRKETRMSLRDIIEALELGAKNAISTSVCCAVVGFVVGSVSLSGLGMLLTHSIIKLGQGLLLPTLLISAASSLVLSMGLPTTAVYIITATLVAPGLVALGVAPLVAHLFCYDWGGVSAITPPVALAAYVAAGIAGSNIMKTGFTAMRLGAAAYILPFYFVYHPALIARGTSTFLEIALAVLGGLVAVFCMGAIGEQYLVRRLPWYKSFMLITAIILIMYPTTFPQVLAVLLALFVGITEYIKRSTDRRPPLEAKSI
jgi:TRAP transporter 4TM/12TM fusion protein